MEKPKRRIVIFLAGLFAGLSLAGILALDPPDDKDKLVDIKPDGRLQYKWYAPALPKAISFAGEAVPLDRWEVRERLDRDVLVNYYMHGSLLYKLKLASRYFPEIEARLKANGVPEDFKYLCVAESSLQHLTSSAGAESFWQFLDGTGREYGLEINKEVDERYDIAKATDAACAYFIKAREKFGSWTAAAASYNCGMGGYNSAATFQGSYDYYDLYLPEETNRYIFRILALKYLMSGARQMGYILEKGDGYLPFKTRTVTVSSSIPNLAVFAREQGSNYKMLKILNPWLRNRSLTVANGKTYQIKLPLEATEKGQ